MTRSRFTSLKDHVVPTNYLHSDDHDLPNLDKYDSDGEDGNPVRYSDVTRPRVGTNCLFC